MKKLELKSVTLIVVFVIIGLAIFLLEGTLKPANHGSLLFALLFWAAIVPGCVALVAAVDLAQGKWIAPLKKQLLSLYPMILLIAVLFLFMGRQMHIYHWAEEQSGLWFNEWSFLIRNFILLVVSFVIAAKFARESLQESKQKKIWAALYLLSFVVSQSLIGFDWVMSLEYPWISTLFGAYFFIEATYLGLASAAIFCFLVLRKSSSENSELVKKTQSDVATFMFGFSLFWAGMFFAQFLTIWYGNIPEEVSFTTRRLASPVLKQMARYILGALFVVPFLALLSRKIKASPMLVVIIALIIMSGVVVERLFFLLPHVSMNNLIAGAEMLLLLIAFILTVSSRERRLELSQ